MKLHSATSFCLCALTACLVATLPAMAGTLSVLPAPGSPGVTLNFVSASGSVGGLDLIGTSLITDGTLAAYLTDFGTPGSQNTVLYGANLGVTEALTVTFDTNSLTFSPDLLTAVLSGTARVVTSGITDPLLVSLLASGGVDQYVFSYASAAAVQPGVNIVTYDLFAIQSPAIVPEPSSFAMLFAGFSVGCVLLLRRRSVKGRRIE